MKTILLVPLRDYYQSRKRIWVKYLIPVVLGLLALAGALIFNIGNEETIRSTFSEFVNVQINVVAILVSFSVAIISISASGRTRKTTVRRSDKLRRLRLTGGCCAERFLYHGGDRA